MSAEGRDSNLLSVPNLGPRSVEMLQSVGICSREDLQSLGAVKAYYLVHQTSGQTSLNLLWALAAGLRGMHFTDLTTQHKSVLLHELNQLGSDGE